MSEVVVCALDLIASTIPDSPKDVKGHDAQEGDTEELDVVRAPAAADGQATGQPVTVVDLGEKRLGSKLPEKSDIPNSPYSASTNLVRYKCSCGSLKPICRLYFCRHCLDIR